MSRLLSTIRDMGEREWTTISADCVLDVKWFQLYAQSSNGVALYSTIKPICEIECNSSLQGGGGNSGSVCYSWKYNDPHVSRFTAIHQLEAVNLLVAVKTLGPINAPPGSKILVWTDNMASSFALESGRTRDQVLAACARELWLFVAESNIDIQINHRSGELIPLADALSRRHQDPDKAALADALILRHNLRVVPPVLNDFKFFDEHSLAPGTLKNKANQARLYIKFCLAYNISYLHPTILDVALFTRFLGNSFTSTATIKNYLSGAKSWVTHHRGDYHAFGSPESGDVLRHIAATNNHIPTPALR